MLPNIAELLTYAHFTWVELRFLLSPLKMLSVSSYISLTGPITWFGYVGATHIVCLGQELIRLQVYYWF